MPGTLFTNANILTMDEERPTADAVFVRGGEIRFVGDAREAGACADADAERRDLGGLTLVPGFNDNHLHAIILGDHELAPNLGGLDTPAIVELLRERWKDEPPGRILMAFNWDYAACPNPRKEDLDAAFPRNPIILSQFSGHAQWLNGVSLEALGIRRGSRDPRMGQVLRDPDGEPTGIVRDLGDTGLSKKRFGMIFFDRRERDLRLAIALDIFRRNGITSVQDNTWFHAPLASLARLKARGELTARFSCWSMGRRKWATPAMRAAFALGDLVGSFDRDWIRPGPVKFFLDGAFSTKTACLCEPYSDDPIIDDSALPGAVSSCEDPDPSADFSRATFSRGDFSRGDFSRGLCSDIEAPTAEIEYLASHRLQGAFHIIGDRGIAIFLDAVEAMHLPDLARLRLRIEHAQLIRSKDIPRIRDLGILIAAQPSALGDPAKDERLLGRDRALRAYPYRSLLDAGVQLSFGSDIPGEATCDPLLSIHMAVNREGPEAISPMEALRCYTVGSAYAEFTEARKGRIVPGMLADFVLLSADPTRVDPTSIREIRVMETILGGKTVWKRE